MIIQYILFSIIPEFKVGLANAWTGTFFIMLLPYVCRRIYGRKESRRSGPVESYNKQEKRIIDYTMAVYYLIVLYSIVLPLKPFTGAFYIGLVIFIIALTCLLATYHDFYSSSGGELVTRGMFSISRNPFYLFTSLAYLGVGIASLSWLLMLLTVLFILLQHQVVLAEERICGLNFGKEYMDYKRRVPRYLLFF